MIALRSIARAAQALRRATPAGGAAKAGRGCAWTVLAGVSVASAVWADTGFGVAVALDSGLDVTFHDVIQDVAGDGLTYRFRFVVPGIGATLTYPDVADDIVRLCDDFALPRVPQPGPQPSRIVITLMSEPTEFGVTNPDVTQFFESFSIEDGVCIWEVF